MQFLKHAQNQQRLQQQRMTHSQPSEQQPAFTAKGFPVAPGQQSQQQSTQPIKHTIHTSVQGTKPSIHTAFTPAQLAILKYQIMAYKLISKNTPLPTHLQQAVLAPMTDDTNYPQRSPRTENTRRNSLQPSSTTLPTTQQEETSLPISAPIPLTPPSNTMVDPSNSIPTTTIPIIDPSTSQPNTDPTATTAAPPSNPLLPAYNAYASPYKLMKKPISSFVHASRQQRHLIPSITTSGVDPQAISHEREKQIQGRMVHRKSQLESELKRALSANGMSGEIKIQIKAMVELKSLKLLEKQKKLRREFVSGMARGSVIATSTDRLAYRKMKRLSLREVRTMESIERQQRVDRQQREKQLQLDHLQHICDHGRNMIAAQRTWQAKQTKLGRAILQFHQHIEKEEQKKAERLSKERIKALRNDDEEAYMKLIDEAKDTRLTLLLRQTGSFLESLSKAVVDQQNDHRTTTTTDIIPDGDDMDENSTVDPDTKIDYFKVTHRVKEDVYQPKILVGGTLKDYQLKGLQWMVSLYNNHLNGILADEMGLGKTIQTISLITYLIEMKKQQGPYLIIVPLSTLTNWNLEFGKWAPSVAKIVYKGAPQTRRALQMEIRQGGFQVLLTTFEYIIKDRPLLSKIKWLHMIIDEGHRIKNTNSKLTYTLRTHYNTRYRLILTGTPLQNNLPELWALLNFILPKIFKSVKSFEEWFNTPFSNQGVQDKIDINEEEQLLIIKRLHKVLRPFLLRRLKKDVESELPDKVERVVKCRLSALQSRLYNQLKKHGILYTSADKNGKSGIKGLNNTIMQLRKLCNHPFVFEGVENTVNPSRRSNDMLYRTAGKFELLDRMLPKLRQTGHRVLIFFQMTQIMSIMEDFLNYRGFAYLRLDGSTKADDRSQLLQIFNAPDSPYFIFLLSTRAGGLGLNLQTADTVIIFDSDWNPHQDLQAQDRAHRIGQTKEVRIFRLISANSIEENILAKANYKLDIDGKVIQAGKFDNRSTDEDREAFLRNLLEDKNDEDGQDSDAEEDLDDEELNEMLKRSDQELAIFKKIDADRNRTEFEMHKRMSTGNGKKYERLIQDDELPEVYRNEAVAQNAGPLVELGRGQRARDEVHYDDGLTEEEWTAALENGDINLNDLVSGQHSKKGRRRGDKSAVNYSDESDSGLKRGRRDANAFAMMDDSGYKKRGRPKKGEMDSKRKKTKREDYSGPDIIPPRIRQQMTKIFENCYKAVEESRAEDEHTYRNRSQLFMDLVSKRDYPIYYTMIKNPISMKMINKRIHSPYYKTIQQFRADFDLMFDNARTFNEEGSLYMKMRMKCRKYYAPISNTIVLAMFYLNWRLNSVNTEARIQWHIVKQQT
ncbi:SNF2 family N-terminal domain-domain-containing protein [Absidia repens]|uniref:SNF2 family N-terminal domain-domain-containing protein n=1 Tax=Absidia repens TaxID=90262 RepID=A0A1X2IUQ9_9FUNG|nr:SNF2 family N-terminal domain-domain-containing protein [Absidia repens]